MERFQLVPVNEQAFVYEQNAGGNDGRSGKLTFQMLMCINVNACENSIRLQEATVQTRTRLPYKRLQMVKRFM